jgi:arylsulfatase A-like enzyme
LLPQCEIHHRGLSIDVGTPASEYFRSARSGPAGGVSTVERQGATFGRVRSRTLSYDFWLDEPQLDVFVSLRVFGGVSRTVSVHLDDKRVGVLRLAPGEARIVSTPALPGTLVPGRHQLSLRFVGKLRGSDDAYAELDWLRVGVADPLQATYAAPTLRDIVTDAVVLAKRPMRSIVLRAPSSVRCPLRVAPASELKFALGYWGAGQGTLQVRVLSDGEPPATLLERKVAGGPGARWEPVRVDLAPFAGRLVALELDVLEATRGGRVALGDPTLAYKQPEAGGIPAARTAVVVIGAGLDRRQIPPWGATGPLSSFGELSRHGAAFTACRAPSSVPAAAVASMLTGLSPRQHAVEDPAARLPGSLRTLGELVKEGSGRTAMFTAVPTTFAAFGFNAGWDRYEAVSPVKDVPVQEPFVLAARWLEQEFASEDAARRLLVVHTRGGHPPWDVTREEVGKLKPDDYAGPIDPRRGAITLANVRARKQRSQRRLTDDDWTRVRELSLAALIKQSAGLQQLLSTLRRAGAWDDTLFVFVGDVGAGDAPELPYDPAGALTEDRLLVPLLVKFPGRHFAGREIATSVSSTDIARTVLEALRLKVPDRVGGTSLFAAASGRDLPLGRALVATLGNHYSTRAGSWLLRGELGKGPNLCQLDVDPACVNDVFDKRPIAARALWQWTFDAALRRPETSDAEPMREPASIDAETAAALTVWGAL